MLQSVSSLYHSFSVFLNIYVFPFFSVVHPLLFNNNSSVSKSFSPGHVERHSRQLIYETNILNIFNDFKNFLTVPNSSVNFNFDHDFSFNVIFNYDFNVNATCNDSLLIPEHILTLYTEFITVLV